MKYFYPGEANRLFRIGDEGVLSSSFSREHIRVSVEKVIRYPFHWHPCIEIIVVLNGSVSLYRRVESKTLEAGEVEIINIDEAHHIDAIDADNVVVILQMDSAFVEQYFPDIRKYLFNCSMFPICDKNKIETEALKRMVCGLALTLLDSKAAAVSDKKIGEAAEDILRFLIAHFERINQYIEGCNDLYLRIFLDTRKYNMDNIGNLPELKEVAEKAHYNKYYLSHLCKNKFGCSLSENSNIYKIAYSVKLLLSTDMNVCMIAMSCGFSASHYYNRHFNNLLHIEPLEFREKYRTEYCEYNTLQKCQKLDPFAAEALLKSSLADWLDSADAPVSVDLAGSLKVMKKLWLKSLNVYRLDDLCCREKQEIFRKLWLETGFRGVRLYPDPTDREFLQKMSAAMGFLNELNAEVKIILPAAEITEELVKALKNCLATLCADSLALKTCSFYYGGKKDAGFCSAAEIFHRNVLTLLAPKRNPRCIRESALNDTAYLAWLIVKDSLDGKREIDYLQPFDDGPSSSGRVFGGRCGLITAQGLYKPAYYAYCLLSQLGDKKLANGDGYVVTQKGDTIRILFYNSTSKKSLPFKGLSTEALNASFGGGERCVMHEKLRLLPLDGRYKISRYTLNHATSAMGHLSDPEGIYILAAADIEALNRASFPGFSIGFCEGDFADIEAELPPYGVELVIIQKISASDN
jgi:AraC-like DNA-binding protein